MSRSRGTVRGKGSWTGARYNVGLSLTYETGTMTTVAKGGTAMMVKTKGAQG